MSEELMKLYRYMLRQRVFTYLNETVKQPNGEYWIYFTHRYIAPDLTRRIIIKLKPNEAKK